MWLAEEQLTPIAVTVRDANTGLVYNIILRKDFVSALGLRLTDRP